MNLEKKSAAHLIVGNLVASLCHEIYLLAVQLTDIYGVTIVDEFDVDGILQYLLQIGKPLVSTEIIPNAQVFKIVFLLLLKDMLATDVIAPHAVNHVSSTQCLHIISHCVRGH